MVAKRCNHCGRNIGKAGHVCPVPDLHKTCTCCHSTFPIEEFPKRKSHNGKRYPSSLCKACTSAKASEWSKANPEKRAAIAKRSSNARLSLHRKESREYSARNPERSRKSKSEWIIRNPEKRKLAASAYARTHPEKSKEHYHNRRSRIKGGGGKHTAEDIDRIRQRQREVCATPGCGAKLNAGYERDHVMPLALGGTNDAGNIQLLCRPCNRKKNAKHPDQWAAEVGVLFV